MPTAKSRKMLVTKTLNTHTHSIECEAAQSANIFFAQIIWITFYRNLGILADFKTRINAVENFRQLRNRKLRRRSTAKIDSLYMFAVQIIPPKKEFLP